MLSIISFRLVQQYEQYSYCPVVFKYLDNFTLPRRVGTEGSGYACNIARVYLRNWFMQNKFADAEQFQ